MVHVAVMGAAALAVSVFALVAAFVFVAGAVGPIRGQTPSRRFATSSAAANERRDEPTASRNVSRSSA